MNRVQRTNILERLSRIRRSVVVRLEDDEPRRNVRLDAVRGEGVRAFRMRCSQDSNPYHRGHSEELYRAWRDGWLEEWRKRR